MTDKPEACECCGWETEDLDTYDQRTLPESAPSMTWLCFVCSSTFAGHTEMYPSHRTSNEEIIRAVAWGINYLKQAQEEK